MNETAPDWPPSPFELKYGRDAARRWSRVSRALLAQMLTGVVAWAMIMSQTLGPRAFVIQAVVVGFATIGYLMLWRMRSSDRRYYGAQ